MKRMPKMKFLLAVITAVLLLMGMTITAYADSASPSFTYNYPVNGVNFKLYEVGEVIDDVFTLTGDFAGYSVNLMDDKAGETLAAYVERDGLQPAFSAVTANESVKFENLQQKIYLLIGEVKVVDRVKYIPSAVLFSVPQQDETTGELIWDITSGGKYEKEDLPALVEISVEKIWKDTGYESKRPSSIKVQLLKDGKVEDTKELSKSNNWKYTWTNLDPEYTWKVVEEKVPANYTVTIKTEKGVTIIENTYKNSSTPTPTPTPTPSPHIPYTGQLWWPVGILVVLGIGLVLLGMIRRKRSE